MGGGKLFIMDHRLMLIRKNQVSKVLSLAGMPGDVRGLFGDGESYPDYKFISLLIIL